MKDKNNIAGDNAQKNQRQQKNDYNKQKTPNIIINKVSTNFSNDNNNKSNKNTNNKIFKDSISKQSNENINYYKKNKNFQNIYDNIQKYSKLNKVNKRFFNSRDKIMKDNSIFNKVKSKDVIISNNIKKARKLFFYDKNENINNNSDINKKLKNIIYKKTNNILKNKIRRYKENDENYIKIEELNEIISSSDTENINLSKNPENIKIETNSDTNSKLDEKEIISNTITIKDELVNYDSDEETKIDNNLLRDSNNFNNELEIILDKHFTQINFSKNLKNTKNKGISSQSPPPKQVFHEHDKKSQMLSLNLNTINQIKEYPFHNSNINNNRDIPVNTSKLNKINKNIIRKSHHIKKNKKELMLINYLKQNFFSKNEENNKR